ncbi:MAG: phosphate-starvation-inducible PsiE family protein [Hyphomicrobiales bacterium]|nr:phosphate-starvation-inducible PsiE family protein [Hyphomicrobiales bacterium]
MPHQRHDPSLIDPESLPLPFRKINAAALQAMAWLNGFAHIVLGLALAASVLLFTWLFFSDVVASFGHDNMAQGFLHGLGSLMLLWTVSALISAEIRYMRGHALTVDTFVEVAIVVILRKLITMPVQSTLPSPQEFLLWVGSAVLLGVMYLIVRYALTIERRPSQS